MNHSARRLNTLARALSATRYLEIGVSSGTTFLDVDIEHKVAVDPAFRFDTSPHASERVQFFSMPSDRYFAEQAGDAVFDVVFLDGLHTFEQTLRDFNNSLVHGHERTVWLIDDTVPSDVYSAIKSMPDALRARKAAGGSGRAWHGDVFKLVFFLHDFFPGLSYCTLTTGGNAQTLVWREPRITAVPAFADMEAIARLDYFALRDSLVLLNPLPEDAGLQRVLDGLQ